MCPTRETLRAFRPVFTRRDAAENAEADTAHEADVDDVTVAEARGAEVDADEGGGHEVGAAGGGGEEGGEEVGQEGGGVGGGAGWWGFVVSVGLVLIG